VGENEKGIGSGHQKCQQGDPPTCLTASHLDNMTGFTYKGFD
jgi:hypothetical protein